MRLGDIAPKVIEERRKIELPQAGDRVYYDDSGSIRYGTVKRVGPDLVQMISGTRIPKGQVHLRGRGPTIRNPIIDETLRIHGGIARLPDDIAQTVLDPKRGGFGRVELILKVEVRLVELILKHQKDLFYLIVKCQVRANQIVY